MPAPAKQLRKQLVENCRLSLDIDRLIELRILVPGIPSSTTLYWTDAGQKIFSVQFEAQVLHPTLSWIELRFSIADPHSRKTREIVQTIPIASTYPGFGRVRYWFVDEEHRVQKLYLPEGCQEFRSRHVHRLAYASQRLTRSERGNRRRAKIMRRLGAPPDSHFVPAKPKHMRWCTYRRLLSRLLHTRQQADSVDISKNVHLTIWPEPFPTAPCSPTMGFSAPWAGGEPLRQCQG
jgi:hypothetical protein